MFDLSQVESEKSFTPIKPGEAVPVKLEKVEVSESGDLDFYFVGTAPDNAGSFKPRFWANNFDPSDSRYDAENAGNQVKQIKQILEAYLDNDTVAKLKGGSAAEFFASVAQALNPGVTADIDATMKIIYKWNSDKDCVIPKYRSFISTTFRPRGLKLNDKLDQKGVPYDRVLPMADYGVVADGGAPAASAGGDAPFGADTPTPAFGS